MEMQGTVLPSNDPHTTLIRTAWYSIAWLLSWFPKNNLHFTVTKVAARAPCDAFDPWVRLERGQVGIWEFVRHRRRPEIWEFRNMRTYNSGDMESNKSKTQNIKIKNHSARKVGKVWISRKENILTLFQQWWICVLPKPKNILFNWQKQKKNK